MALVGNTVPIVGNTGSIDMPVYFQFFKMYLTDTNYDNVSIDVSTNTLVGKPIVIRTFHPGSDVTPVGIAQKMIPDKFPNA
ncbi:MAG: hypothetical protein WA364_00090 [Candidatus Nitrosopolaris sp.]